MPARLAARPKLEPPYWIRDAAARVSRSPAELDAACKRGDARRVPGAGADEDRSAAPELFVKACDAGYDSAREPWKLCRGSDARQ